jgi:hypothetical protein
MTSVPTKIALLSTLLGSLTVVLSCVSPDPEASEEAFRDRAYGTTEDAGVDVVVPDDTGVPPTDGITVSCYPEDLSGEFLLSIVVTPLDRPGEKPLAIRTTVSMEEDGEYTFSFQPIATDLVLDEDNILVPRVANGAPGDEDYSPAPRDDVGQAIVVTDIAVGEDGAFSLAVDEIRVEGFANSLTYRDILTSLTLSGNLLDGDLGCGSVAGNSTEPIRLNLESSTFGLIRVDDVKTYEGDFVRSCEAPELETACQDVEPPSCYPDDLSGQLLLAAVVTPLDRPAEKPLIIRVEVAIEDDQQYTFTFQPIATDLVLDADNNLVPRTQNGSPGDDDYSPAPREDVGTPIVVPDVAIGADGAFGLTVEAIRIEGFANALTYRDILADLTLNGNFLDGDLGCGAVTGMSSEPIRLNLESSTFGFIREDDVFGYEGAFVRDCAAPELAAACQ